MNCAWSGKLQEALAHVQSGELSNRVRDGFKTSYGIIPGISEFQAWQGSLPRTIEALGGSLDPGIHVLIEYRLPFNGQRVDLLLLGQTGNKPNAHVVELKHWTESSVHPDLDHFVLTAGVETPHPSYQAANYAGKLRYFHSVAHNWKVSASAFVLDRSPDLHAGLRDGKYADLWSTAPVFLPGENVAFTRFVGGETHNPSASSDVAAFINGIYGQSLRLLDALTAHQEQILNRAMATLAISGWGLSDEQLLMYDRILATVNQGTPAIFLLSGGPGSGKTLLAVHLLLALAKAGHSTVLAVRNNRLNAALKAVIDFKPFGSAGMIKYFSTKPYSSSGVEDDSARIADVVVCDEGQRLTLASDNVFRRAPVTVVLYDEGQILNREEAGTTNRLLSLASTTGKVVHQYELPTLHRCRGGREYVEWVVGLLTSPESVQRLPRGWEADYRFTILSSAKELVAALSSIAQPATRIALLASFTRSSGHDKPKSSNDLCRIRIPEVSPPISWLMDPTKDYVPFWVDGRSNNLTHCASIYGCQGFETDYAGLIWGDDLVVRNGKWIIGNPESCYDTAPGATPLASVMRKNPVEALQLLKNRYRILLTRGIFGTFAYCEDAETQEFLLDVARRGV